MNRIIGLDYGRQRVGVAICDALQITAQPLETFDGLSWAEIVTKLNVIIKENSVTMIILGHPLTLRGEEGRMAREAERFGMHLRKHLNLEVKLLDERFTSVQSTKILHSMDRKVGRDKGLVDRMAATLLLQAYLDRERQNTPDEHAGEGS